MQRIVFVGNCQVQAIYRLFQKFVWNRSEHELFYVAAYEELDEAGAAAIAKADLIVEQVFDLPPKADIAGLNSRSRRVLVPLVGCNFLWPLAGTAHPQNPSRPFLPGGPYPGEAGISFLNRMIRDGVDAETAVEKFLDYDVPAHIKLDRLFEISIDRQRRRDEMTGYDFASLIERYYRDERLFMTTYHPDLRIAMELASVCLERMGVDPADIARMRKVTRVTPFPKDELPIHPAVVRHFGLNYLPDEPRFRYLNGRRLSVREFALRYMRCEWNEPLEEGIALVKADKMAEAEPRLLEGLERDPKAALGYAALGVARQALGRMDEAVEPLMKAVILDPDNATISLQAGAAMKANGDLDGAEAAFRRAVAIDPYDAHVIAFLVHLLRKRGRNKDAAQVLRDGLLADDRSAKLHLEMAYLAESEQKWDEATLYYRSAQRADPTLPLQAALIRALNFAGRSVEAADLMRQYETLGGADVTTLVAQAQALRKLGSMEQAVELIRAAIAREPDDLNHRLALGEALLQAGWTEEAVVAFQFVCGRRPEAQLAWIKLGEAKLRLGEAVAAETALRAGLALEETTLGYGLLVGALSEQRRFAEAADVSRTMVLREPESAHWHGALGHMLMLAGQATLAVAAIQKAVELGRDHPYFQVELSHALLHAKRADEAVLAARKAVDMDPDHVPIRANLARMLSEVNELRMSRSVWEEVCARDPDNEHFRLHLAVICERLDHDGRVEVEK